MTTASEAKEWAREHIRGLWTSPLTVFHDDDTLDNEGLVYNVEYLLKLGIEGIGYGHGEPWSMSHAERMASAETFIDAVAGRIPCYVHTFDHSAPDTVDLTNHAADHGADLVMIEPPYEWAKSERHIYDYYKYVTDRTNIAIILLNTPHSGRLMSPDLLRSLAEFPAVCAVKDGINDWNLANRHWKAVHDRVVLSLPREEEAMMCLMYWKQQVQLGTSAIFQLQTQDWKPVRRYVELAYQGRYQEAFEIWSALGELREMWSDKYDVLFGASPEHPIVWTKAWMDVMGMKGGRVRPPARNLDSAVKAEYQKNIKEAIARAMANPLFQRAPYLEGAVAAARS